MFGAVLRLLGIVKTSNTEFEYHRLFGAVLHFLGVVETFTETIHNVYIP